MSDYKVGRITQLSDTPIQVPSKLETIGTHDVKAYTIPQTEIEATQRARDLETVRELIRRHGFTLAEIEGKP